MLPDRILEAAASAPGGLLDLRDLAALGCDRRRVAEWVAGGALERPARGLVRVAGAPVPPTQPLHIAVRSLAPPARPTAGVLISGEAGLGLREVEGFPLPCRPLALVDRTRTVRRRDVAFDVRYVPLERVVGDEVLGIPTTEPAQALADAALRRELSDRRLRVACDDLRSRGVTTLQELLTQWEVIRHPGARRMLAMAPTLELESEGERWCLEEVFRRAPPLPDCQVVLVGRLRVDFVFLFAALIVEYLGGCHDGRADRDATRTFALERRGYRIFLVTRSMLRHAEEVAEHVHAIRREREQLVLEGRLPLPALPPQPWRLSPLRTLVPLG